eukprot:8164-Heterococcus_DN1.PRE.30
MMRTCKIEHVVQHLSCSHLLPGCCLSCTAATSLTPSRVLLALRDTMTDAAAAYRCLKELQGASTQTARSLAGLQVLVPPVRVTARADLSALQSNVMMAAGIEEVVGSEI